MLSKEEATIANFHRAAIGIGAFSSIFYDRMYCGYKVLIGNIGFSDFPMRGSSLNNVCFETYDEMAELIRLSEELSEREFFLRNQMSGFTRWDRPIIAN